jgi:hypothetical protein
MTASKYRVERRAGRLIEAKVFGLRTREDADEYGAAIVAAVRAHSGKEAPVLCADHREVVIYPQPAADRLVELFRPNNSRFERIAILVAATNVTITMQLDRLAREAGFENRRVFREPAGALAHLAGGLDKTELARARAFLADRR